ncbi:MAG: hypothetical protein KGS72_23025 [Cyanobacteria bacterium REEB67]|nr:hypothetical protein [Cyanobacteria bacterium REEB67]
MNAKKILLNPYLHMTILALIVLAVFNRTLGSYFLADDFGEVAYVGKIAHGDWSMLWANFTGNYMQIPSMSVWRPFLLITLLGDFIIWKANPAGYYATNLLFYVGATIALYWLVFNLTSNWCKTRQRLAAFFSALLFSLNPLHCESISWVVGRVDIVCAFFYLLCLNAFILAMRSQESGDKQKSLRLTALSVVSFWLAMWTKEMAIGAPVLAFLIALLWGQPALHLKNALRLSAPLLLSTVLYFGLRYLALGTLLGGYTQGIGDAQAAGALSHWLDPDTARRLFFPLAYSIYGGDSFYLRALATTYILLIVMFLLRLFSLTLPLRWLLFMPVWLLTALAPIYKLWGLGYELEGARFVFFATMPLSTLLPVFLLAPHSGAAGGKSASESYFHKAFAVLSLGGLIAIAFMYAKIASHLNLEWVHAGKEVRSFAEAARTLALREKAPTLPLLAIPKRRGGAHMVLNGTTFQLLLRPPFVAETLNDPFLTFDPIIFGNADYLNATRFKADLKRSNGRAVFWDSKNRTFRTLTLREKVQAKELPRLDLPHNTPPLFLHSLGHALIKDRAGQPSIEEIRGGDGIYFGDLDLSPLDFDLLEVKLRFVEKPDQKQAPLLSLAWQQADAEKHAVSSSIKSNDTNEQIVYLRPSQNFHWYEEEKIDHLFLELPPQTKVVVESVRLLKADEVCPSISLTNSTNLSNLTNLTDAAKTSTAKLNTAPISSIGSYAIKEGAVPALSVVAPANLPFQKIVVDVSKPNAFFENFSDTDMKNAVQATIDVTGGRALLPPLAAGANYELRARTLDRSGQTVGAPSDPLVLRINK